MRINPVKIFQQSDNKFLFLVQFFFIITAPTFDPLKMIKLKKKEKKRPSLRLSKFWSIYV